MIHVTVGNEYMPEFAHVIQQHIAHPGSRVQQDIIIHQKGGCSQVLPYATTAT
jgi:hypothetical protein